jgi:hypothetical protein
MYKFSKTEYKAESRLLPISKEYNRVAGVVTEVVDCLPSKYNPMSSYSNIAKSNPKTKQERVNFNFFQQYNSS